MEEPDRDDATESREAIHLVGQVDAIVGVESEGEPDERDERVTLGQRFDQDAAPCGACFEQVHASKGSGTSAEWNRRRRLVEPYFPGIRGHLMAVPEVSSQCMSRVVPESQRRIRWHGEEPFATFLHDQTIVGQRWKSGRCKRCGERRFSSSRLATKRDGFATHHHRRCVESARVFSARDRRQHLIKQQMTDGAHLRSRANVTGQHAKPGGPMEVCEPSKAEDVPAGCSSDREPRPAIRRGPAVNPRTRSGIHASARPLQVECRAPMRAQCQFRQLPGARQNQVAPRVSVPFSGTTGAHLSWNNG